MRQQFEFRVVRISPWQIWLGIIASMLLLTALAILTAGLFLIIAPAVFLAALIYRIANGPVRQAPQEGPKVIDAQYTVVDEGRRDDGRGRG